MNNARDEYNFRHNPPSFEEQNSNATSIGSGGVSGGGSMFGFDSNTAGVNGPTGIGGNGGQPGTEGQPGSIASFGTVPGSSFGQVGNNGPHAMNNGGNSQRRRSADQAFDSAIDATFRGVAKGSSAMVKSFSQSNSEVASRTGNGMLLSGLWLVGIGLFAGLVNFFYPIHGVTSIIYGGLLSVIIGSVMMAFTYAGTDGPVKEEPAAPTQDPIEYEPETDYSMYDDDTEDEWDDDSEDDDWDDEDDWEDGWDDDDDDVDSVPEPISIESAKENINITPGTQTRSYLVEQYLGVLPKSTPKYSKWTEYTEDDDDFVEMEDMIREGARMSMSGDDEDMLPDLLTMRENAFIIEITATRSKKINADKTADELAAIYASRVLVDEHGTPRPGVFATATQAGERMTIVLNKSTKATPVTLGDVLVNEQNWVKDISNPLPILLGIDERGRVNKSDISRVESLLLSGEPRSGKSETAKSIITQMCMYNSPGELNIYVGDLKGAVSDWNAMNLPHIKHFTSDPEGIIAMIKWFIDYEAPRRKKLLESQKVIKHNDYVAKVPGGRTDMPYTYIVLDEITSLVNTLRARDKDLLNEFYGYLSIFVTQFPALGLRFIGVPHRIVDTTIRKDISAQVSNKVMLKPTEDLIKTNFGVTRRDFPYRMTNIGETAAKLGDIGGVNNGGLPAYSRSLLLSPPSNQDSLAGIYEFIRYVWFKLDHEHYHGPRIDQLDKSNDSFDGYECGCKSTGGVGTGLRSATQGTAGNNGNPALGKLRGGYVEDTQGNDRLSLRRDGSSARDVMDDFGDDDLDEFAGLFK